MFIRFVLLLLVFGEEEETLGGYANGNMESLLVILLGIVEEVSNINDSVLRELELVVKFLESSSCKHAL